MAAAILAAGLCLAAEKPGDALDPVLARVEGELRAGCRCESLRVEWRLGEAVRGAAAGLDSLKAVLIPATPEETPADHAPDVARVRILGQHAGRTVEYLGSGEVRCLGPVWLLRRALRAGAPISPQDVTRETGWFTPQALAVDEAVLFASAARQPLERGRALCPADLMSPPWVRRGVKLSILYQTPGMSVEGVGIARTDAWRGDRVSVRLMGASRDCEGVVTGPNRVEIRPGGGNG